MVTRREGAVGIMVGGPWWGEEVVLSGVQNASLEASTRACISFPCWFFKTGVPYAALTVLELALGPDFPRTQILLPLPSMYGDQRHMPLLPS